ncbi:hypothetical protein D5018_20580 [Parashewanella curva]|uniref:Uncharacterized protein n=2 Tax=Parashewanella curva TaxID=2338552 RepID=A0A3L8PR26_9GAMM|nr:hypothetical protein D5018_20580 [Parashewanella curva]
MFWATFALLILPFPFKLVSMITGKDKRSFAVKFEEISNAAFLAIGLIAFWEYSYSSNTSSTPMFWYVWLSIAVIWSIVAIFKSSKLDYAKEQIGTKATVILSIFSTIFFIPMFIAVFNYAD